MKKKHKLVNDGNGFMICLDCSFSTGELLENPDMSVECKKPTQVTK